MAAIPYTIPSLADSAALTGAELIEVSQLSTIVLRTATTISANATDNSFNDSAGGFLTAGFVVGMSVLSSGWTGGATANNKRVRDVTAVSANKLVFAGADGDDIVTAAAGATVTLTAWLSRALPLADLPVPDAAEISYSPADAGDWAGGGDPGSASDALDQAAARLAALESVDPVAVVSGFYPGAPTANALLLVSPLVLAATFPANFAGCRVEAEIAATATTVLTVKLGATTIGTATFAAGGTVATLATTSGTVKPFTGADKLFFVAPATPDATLANVSWAFLADR